MLKKIPGLKFTKYFFAFLFITLLFTSASWAGNNIEVNAGTSKGTALSGVKVYAFTGAGSYTGKYSTTDSNGTAVFDKSLFSAGNYKFRADYLGNQFWSGVLISLPYHSINCNCDI